jgi:hypothetical protein
LGGCGPVNVRVRVSSRGRPGRQTGSDPAGLPLRAHSATASARRGHFAQAAVAALRPEPGRRPVVSTAEPGSPTARLLPVLASGSVATRPLSPKNVAGPAIRPVAIGELASGEPVRGWCGESKLAYGCCGCTVGYGGVA